jgi:hypothetical protein
MSKVRNFAETAPNIGFSEFDFYDLYRSTFEKSEFGRIKSLLPLYEMAENFGLVKERMRPKVSASVLWLQRNSGLPCCVAMFFCPIYELNPES